MLLKKEKRGDSTWRLCAFSLKNNFQACFSGSDFDSDFDSSF